MYSVGGISIIDLGLLTWVLVLSFYLYRQNRKFKLILPQMQDKEGKTSLLSKFQGVLDELENLNKREQLLNRNLKDFSLEGLNHIQKVSLIRYNPYGDTGGDQSFSLCLLDGKGIGILLTSLHTRSGTRIYARKINEGKSELQLSKEEQETLNKALNL